MAKNLFIAKIVAAGAAVLLAAGLTVALWPRPAREPFYGVHQAGVATAAQKFAFVAAFDLTTAKADEVRTLFKTWTRAAAALSQGKPLDEAPASVPPADTGETLGYKPARLTFTFGVGPSLFDGRFGLTDRRPGALVPLPAFPGDQLNPQWCDGDLVVQVAADDFQTAYHAVHTLTRLAKGVAVPRWAQAGFQPGLEVNPRGPGRNLQGFIDGTVNPDTTKPEAMDQVVWVDQGPAWMRGGAYLVVRRIRMFVETWDRTSRADQERTIGRDRLRGEPLAAQAEDSHVKLARGAGVVRVIASHPAREALAIETVRNRFIASARPGERHLFTLPTPVVQHLGLQVYSRGTKLRGTDDRIIWFVPAPEYYEYRSVVEAGKTWDGPSGGPFARVYVAKSLFPFPKEFQPLAELEYRIEEEEWRPAVEALQRVGRGRRVVL